MRKKLASQKGMTLIEMLAAVLIIALLAAGMSAGMTSGMRVYASAAFESGSSALAANINTTLADLLGYSSNFIQPAQEGAPEFLITNWEYGIENCYIDCPKDDPLSDTDDWGIVRVYHWSTSPADTRPPKALVNSGSYDNLRVTDFTIHPVSDIHGNYFEISYRIISTVDANSSRDVKSIVRMMNP